MTVDVREEGAPPGLRDVGFHFTTFQRLVARGEDLLDAGRWEEAALCAGTAARYAWHNHPGVFASPRLERILLAIGREPSPLDPPSELTRPAASGTPMHVLHVLTQAYTIGGHTRLVSRWIQRDAARAHSVAITCQRGREVPLRLREAVQASHGKLRILDTEAGSIMRQANELRDLALSSDRVILHIHPHDVIPLIALAPPNRLPPVIFLNHADHVFWIGVGISDAVACIRDSGLSLARERRGIEDRRCVLLPIPLTPVERTLSRQEAKKRLGVGENSVLILSVASAYKYGSSTGAGFADAMTPVLEQHERATVVVVGPGPEGPWRASVRAHERFLPVGVHDDVTPFYQAADIYVDSFPFSSLTSLLEAGSYGVPLVSYCSHPSPAALLCADDPALAAGITRVTSIGQLRDALVHLIEDEALRTRLGARAREDILRIHSGARWKDALENVYLRAAALAGASMTLEEHRQAPADALDAELVRLHTHPSIPGSLEACVVVQIAEGLAAPDLAPVTHLRGYAMTMLRTFPWLIRSPSVRSSVASVVSRLALASDKPLRATRQTCTALREAVRKDNAVEKPWVRRLLAAVWEDVAVALNESRGTERAAAFAAARALLSNPFEPSPRGRKLLVRLMVRGAIGGRADSIAAMPESRRRRSSSH